MTKPRFDIAAQVRELGADSLLPPAKCKWCKEGREPNENGEHWIVQSIIPAKIKIVKCKRHPPTEAAGQK